MTEHPWWESGVIYQVYPRSFMDESGDGVGDLAGITSKLSYLSWLGVDALWMSPIFPSPMADFGYDVSDYTDIEPLFGTLSDFDALVAEAHSLGLKVILDYVPNHTSDEHPWFVESRASRSNPKRDWYIWRDAKADGSPPNNWESQFGGPAWELDTATSQYYLHLFDKKQPDLNWRNPEVREAMYDALRFWFERGVDGFRIDVLSQLIKDEQLRDNPENPDWEEGQKLSLKQERLYTQDRPEMAEVVREIRAIADEYEDRVLIGELYLPVERLISYYGESLDGIHLPFNFGLVTMEGWDAKTVGALVEEYEALLPDGAWPNWVLGNHDNPRVASRIGEENAPLAAMLLLTLRGTPTLYYGDEIGLLDGRVPPEEAHDPPGKLHAGYGRDPERTPMQWDDSENAGFSAAKPWLPAKTTSRVNVESEREDSRSILTLHRRLLALRLAENALSTGSYETVETRGNVFAYLRESEGRRFLVALNFGERTTLDLGFEGRVSLSTRLDREGEEVAGEIELREREGVVIEVSV